MTIIITIDSNYIIILFCNQLAVNAVKQTLTNKQTLRAKVDFNAIWSVISMDFCDVMISFKSFMVKSEIFEGEFSTTNVWNATVISIKLLVNWVHSTARSLIFCGFVSTSQRKKDLIIAWHSTLFHFFFFWKNIIADCYFFSLS